MLSIFTLIPGVIILALRSITFSRPQELLPPVVKLRGAGFLSLLVGFFLASALRHLVAGEATVGTVGDFFVSNVTTIFVAFLVLNRNWKNVALYLCASIGVDLIGSGLSVFGMDIQSSAYAWISFGWEISATAYAVKRIRKNDVCNRLS